MKSLLISLLEERKTFYEEEITHLNTKNEELKKQIKTMESKMTDHLSKQEIGSFMQFDVY